LGSRRRSRPDRERVGAQDLGAFERPFVYALDTIYCDGFEPPG
jgi:hypothetical protein